MEEKKTEILEATKLYLGIKNNDDDKFIMLMIDDAISAVLSYCRIDVLPCQLESFIPIVVSRQFRSGINSSVKSVTEGERRVEYSDAEYDFLTEYSVRLRPFVNRNVYLPSDLEVSENESV